MVQSYYSSNKRATFHLEKCPDYIDQKKYFVDENNPRIALNANQCTIIGNTPLPLNEVISWNIKLLKSLHNDLDSVYIGVAPSDINQSDEDNNIKCGWYFDCYSSILCSGPPHNYRNTRYGIKKKYVYEGDSIGVVMDTTKGDLSFYLNGINFGVAYEGIPLDKPLVPCAVHKNQGCSVKFSLSKMKENVDSTIPVPSSIVAKSESWDSISISWDSTIISWNNANDTSFYQIEIDGNKIENVTLINEFTKVGLYPDTKHNFRVRTIRANKVSEWSDTVKVRTQKAPEFSECAWKKCPVNVGNDKKYSIDTNNPRIAKNDNKNGYHTIIGNTLIPLNKITSWNIKILKSMVNNGGSIFIGVAPSNIDQNDNNLDNCGWYFYCFNSTLHSGPPHNYKGKEYGPRKENGKYVHAGKSVGVVMDTIKGELSFVISGVNYGIAYEGIPLDKPLVPCVILRFKDDSVELVI